MFLLYQDEYQQPVALHIQFSLVEMRAGVRGKIIKQHNWRHNALLEAAEAGKLNVSTVFGLSGDPVGSQDRLDRTSGDYSRLQVAKVVAGGLGCDRKLV